MRRLLRGVSAGDGRGGGRRVHSALLAECGSEYVLHTAENRLLVNGRTYIDFALSMLFRKVAWYELYISTHARDFVSHLFCRG